jgi:hypothetical protein
MDSSFEALSVGNLEPTGEKDGWEIQRSCREKLSTQFTAAISTAAAHDSAQGVELHLPAESQGFEFITVGQRLHLKPGRSYEALVWVRWPDGPERSPADANATSGHPSAIVSFWVRHQNGKGHFAGRDEWLFDNAWHQLRFSFRATSSSSKSLLYLSLLPNQKPRATTLWLDQLELHETPSTAEVESRSQLLENTHFESDQASSLAPPWYFAPIGGKSVQLHTTSPTGITLSMSEHTSNLESGQLWQHVHLQQGVTYRVNARVRWNNYSAHTPAPILNYGIYHEPSRTWHGPVDQILQKDDHWHDYTFLHVPDQSGSWKFYLQLNGWGNFGQAVSVSVSEVSLQTIPSDSASEQHNNDGK